MHIWYSTPQLSRKTLTILTISNRYTSFSIGKRSYTIAYTGKRDTHALTSNQTINQAYLVGQFMKQWRNDIKASVNYNQLWDTLVTAQVLVICFVLVQFDLYGLSDLPSTMISTTAKSHTYFNMDSERRFYTWNFQILLTYDIWRLGIAQGRHKE